MSARDMSIAVLGATGHTARFVLDELQRRGLRAILVGRNAEALSAVSETYPGSSWRLASIDDPDSLDDALRGTVAVINCAGPFIDTAAPVVDAAVRAKIPYLDLAAEQAAVQSVYARDAQARTAGIAVIPAAAFFGGLADLLVSALLGDEQSVDEITVAVALDSWHPTNGTRVTGSRNTSRRLILRSGALEPMDDPQPRGQWVFPAPFGSQDVAMLPFSEALTLSHHVKATSIDSWINLTALRDVRDPATPAPTPSDEKRRSAQVFAMDVVVRSGDRFQRATAFGRDIYAVSAPIVVEALQRLLTSEAAEMTGVRSLGELFDARGFLEALAAADALNVHYKPLAAPLLTRA
jgi:hypothetical protein